MGTVAGVDVCIWLLYDDDGKILTGNHGFFYHEIGWAFSGFSGLISVFFPTFRSHVAWTPSMMPGESEMIALRNRSAGNITFKMKTK